MAWSFAKVNGELSEIYFDKEKYKIIGYCTVNENDYKSKEEKIWIKEGLKKFDLIYDDGVYKNKIDGREILSLDVSKLKEEDFIKIETLEDILDKY